MCVGDPGPLSPEERERLREERLRLVCSRDACLVIFLNRDVFFLLPEENTHLKTVYLSFLLSFI